MKKMRIFIIPAKVSLIFEENFHPWKKIFIHAVLQKEAKYFKPGSIARGIWRYLVTFVFDPVHLPSIASVNHPVHLDGCARLLESFPLNSCTVERIPDKIFSKSLQLSIFHPVQM